MEFGGSISRSAASLPETALPETEPDEKGFIPSLRRLSSTPPPDRQKLYVKAAAVAVMVAILAGLVAYGYLSYRDGRAEAARVQRQVAADFQAGQADLEAGKALLKKANGDRDELEVNLAKDKFRTARIHFIDGPGHLAASWAIRQGSRLPFASDYLAPRIKAVKQISAMGVALSDVANDAADVDLLLIKPDPGGAKGGVKLLAVLKEAQPGIARVRADFARAKRAVDSIDPSVLPSGQAHLLTTARDTINKGLAGLDQFASLVPVITEILGGNGPRSYLLEQVNPAELRPGGGFLGTFSLISADQGKLSIARSGELGAPQSGSIGVDWPRPWLGSPDYVAPPNVLKGFAGGRSWTLEDSNIFPDFFTNAKEGAFFADHVLHAKVDAVISVDYYTVAAILSVTGPINVPDSDVTYDASNFVSAVVEASDRRLANHKGILAAAAKPLMDKVAELPAGNWSKLIQVLNAQATQHHLQAYFFNGEVESSIGKLGWTANLNPLGTPDFLMEVEANLGGSKANQKLGRTYTLTLTQDGSTLHHHVVVDLHNGNPVYTTYGSYYNAYVRFYGNLKATNLKISSAQGRGYRPIKAQDYPDDRVPEGFKMIDGAFSIDVSFWQDGNYQLIYDYDTPFEANAQGQHQIYWQKQPGTLGDPITVNWIASGRTTTAKGDLGEDRMIVLSLAGVAIQPGTKAAAQLPGLSF